MLLAYGSATHSRVNSSSTDKKDLDRFTLARAIEKEIHRPHMIAAARTIRPRMFFAPRALLATLLRHLQACKLPQSLHAFHIHRSIWPDPQNPHIQ